jgi:bifunctional non-homologous end joining protein LigD
MGLREYQRKRDFSRTPEPSGKAPPRHQGRSFVIQKHAASHLHYDFRLELEGVLKSWAVPKGPSLDPSIKRLAMMTEDHPVEYGGFEGVIPAGEYGGGTVMVWDRGTWEPLEDAHQGLRAGKLTFALHGEKLRGGWRLVKTSPRGRSTKDNAWLLFKAADDEATTDSIVETRPESVISGRQMDAIAKDADRVWHSNRSSGHEPGEEKPRGKGRKSTAAAKPTRGGGISASLPDGAKRARLPASWRPAQPSAARAPRAGDGWLHELAVDGVRVALRIEAGKATVLDKSGRNASKRYPSLIEAAARLPVEAALIDGMVTALREDGTSSAAALSEAVAARDAGRLVFFAFDLVHLDGSSLEPLPVEDRKAALRALLAAAPHPAIRYQDHLIGAGERFFERACQLAVGGALSKRLGSKYAHGKTRDWVLVSCPREAATRKRSRGRRPEAPPERERARTGGTPSQRQGAARGAGRAARSGEPVRGSASRSKGATDEVAGVRITHADRVVYPDAGVTKVGLARFYEGIAEWVLPHLVDRPTTLVRCPDGLSGKCFFQKHRGYWAPDALRRVAIREKTKIGDYLVVDDLPGLVGLVQLGILEVHTWSSTTADLEHPDRVVIDIDPDEALPWSAVVDAAKRVRDAFLALDLESFVKTTGGKGLHVVAPITPEQDWDGVAAFARGFCEQLAEDDPASFVATMAKAARKGRIFLDWLRSVRGATSVAAYSTRAKPGATVSAPLAWKELGARATPDRFTVATLPKRLDALGADPWRGYAKVRQRLPTRP